MTVVFFWSAAARAVAPASPMLLPAAGQHTHDPEPKSAPHDYKAKHASKGSSHENARGRERWQSERSPRRATAQRLSPTPSPHVGRACAAGRGRGPKRPPTPPSPAAARARWRTGEVDCRDRRVLLERGGQSSRGGGADQVHCGGAAHPRPRAQVSATRFQAEARAQGKLARERAGPRARWQGERSPRRATAQRLSLSPPSPDIGRACAAGRGRGPKRPPTPPYPAAARARSRTVEVDRRDRRVLLERGRQSCCAGVVDLVVCGGAAHPQPRAQVSATRFQGEARAREARTRTRGARRCWQGERSPRRAAVQRLSLSPSPHVGRACAAGRGRGPKHPQTPPIPCGRPGTLAHIRG